MLTMDSPNSTSYCMNAGFSEKNWEREGDKNRKEKKEQHIQTDFYPPLSEVWLH